MTTVPADMAGWRLDRVVAALADVSRAEARALVDEGRATLDGRPAPASTRVGAGATIAVDMPPPEPPFVPEEVPFGVRHEDQQLLVVDKPPGVVVHPGAGTTGPTLVAGLLHRYPDLEPLGRERRFGLVHRLDRDTSGLLVIARTDRAFDRLTAALKAREIHREYLALLHGHLDAATATVDAPIGRDPRRPTRMAVRSDGRPSRTHFARTAEWSEVTLSRVTLETGRTHQIRVHAASIGNAVVGDGTYGRSRAVSVTVPRMFLHARRLELAHPSTGKAIEVESPLPDDLASVLAALGPPERGSPDG